jgi:hypothetical protein
MRQQIAIRENEDSVIKVDYSEDEGVSGKYWVIQKNKTGYGNQIIVTRIFETETAWSDAERHANDLLRGLGFDYTQTISF